jgi:hypothetical protein
VIEAALRAAAVPPFHAMAMSREATALEASGRRILHLEVGQPSTPLPQIARDAVRAELDRPLGYTNAAGLMSLRRRLAERTPGVDPERIMVVAGASAGLHAGVPGAVRPRRPRRGAGARLSLLPQRAAGARHHAGAHPGRPRDAASRRRPSTSIGPDTSTG